MGNGSGALPPYSVLMSVYDREEPAYFEESVQSMLRQTVPPEQIVLVEDGPVNETLSGIVDKYQAGAPELFTVLPLPVNGGLANALNKGLEQCRNELVARMDTDDLSLPERCEAQLRLFAEKPELSLVGSHVDEFTDDPEHVTARRVVPCTQEDILKFSRRRNPFNHPTVMYRKSAVLSAGGYNAKRRRAEDFELFVTMLHRGCLAENIDRSLVKFRANDLSQVRKKDWLNCKTTVDIVYGFWKAGYSSALDYAAVLCAHVVMYLAPPRLMQWITRTFLRES